MSETLISIPASFTSGKAKEKGFIVLVVEENILSSISPGLAHGNGYLKIEPEASAKCRSSTNGVLPSQYLITFA
jgi:hypothetical protein